MVEVQRVRAPEVPFARLVVALFTLAVAASLYYVVGGPIPYTIEFGGPTGGAFQGRYALVSDLTDVPPAAGETFTATYPYTVTSWGSRRQSVVASAQTDALTNALLTITVRRAGVVCSEAYLWGTAADVICE